MKKNIIAFFILFVSLQSANAQLAVGVQAGVSITDPSNNLLKNAKGITYIAPGVVFEIPIIKGFNFRPSLNLLQSGFDGSTIINTITSGPNAGQIQTTVQDFLRRNINIPLDFSVGAKIGPGKLMFNFGPSLDVAVKSELVNSVTVGNGAPTVTTTNFTLGNASSLLEQPKINWGSRFGVGYRLNQGFLKGLMLNGMIQKATTAIPNIANTNNIYKPRVISITATYFILGGK